MNPLIIGSADFFLCYLECTCIKSHIFFCFNFITQDGSPVGLGGSR